MKYFASHFFLAFALVVSGTKVTAQSTDRYADLVRRGNSQLQSDNNAQALSSAKAAIKIDARGWEAHTVAGGALMNLKRYEEAADQFSLAIQSAPEAKKQGLRDLRKKCLQAESGPSPDDAGNEASTSDEWRDRSTGLIWARKDNGVDVTWQQAADYCHNVRFGPYSDWRLPTIDELQTIFNPQENINGRHVVGKLLVSGNAWSSSQRDKDGRVATYYNSTAPAAFSFAFDRGEREAFFLDNRAWMRALCVRWETQSDVRLSPSAPPNAAPHSSTEQNVPPTPQPIDRGPSLAATMQFVQGKLDDVGKVDCTVYYQSADGRDSDTQSDMCYETTNVVANPDQCKLSFGSGQGVSLRDVKGVALMSKMQYMNQYVKVPLMHFIPNGGQRELHPVSVTPNITALVVQGAHQKELVTVDFIDATMAGRVAKAITHAVELCGGENGGNKEPF